jgi:hypothetical protein
LLLMAVNAMVDADQDDMSAEMQLIYRRLL